jgi:hypothetical protein
MFRSLIGHNTPSAFDPNLDVQRLASELCEGVALGMMRTRPEYLPSDCFHSAGAGLEVREAPDEEDDDEDERDEEDNDAEEQDDADGYSE